MPRPIFIIGSPRSGTSVLTWAIGQHPNISLQPESNWMPVLARAALDAYRIGTSRGAYSQLSNAHISLPDFAAKFGDAVDAISRECFERRVDQLLPGFRTGAACPAPRSESANGPRLINAPSEPKERWVDGTPEYTFSTYELNLLFPDCQFIHILRRPDQVANSLAHFENAGADGRNIDPATGLTVWVKHTLAAKKAARLFGKRRMLRIDNADLATDGAKTLSRCFAFLGETDCERGVMALKTNLNSSRAADRQEETNSRIAHLPRFKQAMDLYEELRMTDVPFELDLGALEQERRRFEGSASYSAVSSPLNHANPSLRERIQNALLRHLRT